MTDQVPKERQYEAYNHWDTLEDTVEDPKKPDQVWDAFKKSFEKIYFILAFQRHLLSRFQARPQSQQLTWISISSRLSGDANGKKTLRRSR